MADRFVLGERALQQIAEMIRSENSRVKNPDAGLRRQNRVSEVELLQGYLAADLAAATTSATGPGTADLNVYNSDSDGDLVDSSRTVSVTNRDERFTLSAGDYLAVAWLEGEWRPLQATHADRYFRFTLNEDMGASTSSQAAADLLLMDGTDTTEDVNILDPANLYGSLQDGDAGYCVLIGGSYYIAEVGGAGGDVMWQFVLTADMSAGEAAADLYTIDGADASTNVTVLDTSVSDMFSSLTNGSNGWCFERGGSYYVIQAECGEGGGSVASLNNAYAAQSYRVF